MGVAAVRGGVLRAIPHAWLWIATTVLLIIAILAAFIYLWIREPAVVERVVDGPVEALPGPTQARVRQLEALNRSLEQEIARREADPALLACVGDQHGAVPGGAADAPVSAAPELAALPTAPPVPEADTAASADPLPDGAVTGEPLPVLATGELLQRLEKATALVVSEDSIATGFFVAPDLLVTNRHAVESSKDGRVFVASHSLGQALEGRIVGTSPQGPVGAPDFALVRLPQGRAPGVLPVTPRHGKLVNVVAAGYPGLTVMNDAGFRQLIGGDIHAAPDLNVTQGAVQAVQQLSNGATAIVHTASILQGNSGGPLVDTCGRVIGINTFIAVDQEQSGRISYAQPADAVLEFVSRYARIPAADARVCAR